MKKLLCLLLILTLLPFAGCAKEEPVADGKIKITATLFPQYDFAREIGGDKVSVSILLPPGQDSHHYDPSPSDMLKISDSQLFIYTGDEMEPWAKGIASSLGNGINVLNASQGISLFEEEHHDHQGHVHSLDPHIWLDFDNAIKMCANITDALIALSPENEGYFKENFESYTEKLSTLDEEYENAFSSSDKTIVFGGKFALGHMMRRYNVSYKSAYSSCSANSEPSIDDIATLAGFVVENDIKVIFCEEYSDPKVAREIASYNSCQVLPIHSCHNLNKEDSENGETFISLMETNLENLRKGL